MAVRIADTLKQQNNLTTFPVAYGEDIWLDENKGSGTADYDTLQNLYNDGKLGGSDIEVTTMPAASESYIDKVLLYIGETGTYKYGTYYKCVSDGETPPTYSWVDAEIGGGTKIFYGTMDEWDALSADEKKQYDYMADNNAGSNYTDTYSTSEVKTNKVWIDGKPIYRKVFTGLNFGAATSDWTTISNVTVTNVDKLISATALRDRSDSSDYIASISIRLTSSAVKYYSAIEGFPNCTRLILEYTKTTD